MASSKTANATFKLINRLLEKIPLAELPVWSVFQRTSARKICEKTTASITLALLRNLSWMNHDVEHHYSFVDDVEGVRSSKNAFENPPVEK